MKTDFRQRTAGVGSPLVLLFALLGFGVFSCGEDWTAGRPDLENSKPSRKEFGPPPKGPLFKLKLLSYNIWGLYPVAGGIAGWRYAEIGRRLDGYDIVAIQEAWDSRSDDLVNQANFPFEAKSEHAHRLLKGSGLITLSRHPILHSETDFYKGCTGTDCMAMKALLWTRIALPDGSLLDVYNTHLNANLGSKRPNPGAKVRRSQLKQLKAVIQKRSVQYGVDYLVMGDFNIDEDEDLYPEMQAALSAQDLIRAHQALPPFYTYDGQLNDWISRTAEKIAGERSRLDYIWLAQSPNDRRFEILQSGLAFHRKVEVPPEGLAEEEERAREEGEEIDLAKPTHRFLSDHFGVEVVLGAFN